MKHLPLLFVVLTLGACSEPPITAAGGGGKGGSGSGSGGGMPPGSVASSPDGGAASPGGGNTGGPAPGGKNCGLETFKLEQRPAELMLVLDRSGSMNDPAGPMSMGSKWSDVTAALDETIQKTEGLVHWGLKTFPSTDMRCQVSDGVEVPSAPMNHRSVWGRIQGSAPGTGAGGGTPTRLALQRAVAYLDANPSMNPRYLVLATDGEPNCGSGGGGFGGFGSTDDQGAIRAVRDAVSAGYKTFVIGVATSGEADRVLSQMATAGGEPRTATPPYYPVASRQDLIAALGVITGLVTDCVFRLNMPPPSPDDTAVNVAGMRVQRDPSHMNGWDYGAANRTIQFYGPACEAVKNAAGKDVQIVFGCPGVVIP